MTKKFSIWVLGIGLMTALLVAPTAARAEITDADLAERVVDAIQRYGQFSIFDDVIIGVENRVVTLTGRVTAPIKREEIGRRVAKVDGIRTLINDIKVLPLSPYDAELRLRIARAIYSNPGFWQYASMARAADPHHRRRRTRDTDRPGRQPDGPQHRVCACSGAWGFLGPERPESRPLEAAFGYLDVATRTAAIWLRLNVSGPIGVNRIGGRQPG